MNAKRLLTAALLATAVAVGGSAVLLPAGSAYAQDKKKEAPKGDTVSAELGKPLQAAQEALKAKKYKDALAALQQAESAKAEKTPYEQFVLVQMRAAAYAGMQDYPNLVKALETMNDSGRLTAEQQLQQTVTIAQLYYQLQNYDKAIETINKYYAAGGQDQQLNLLKGQAYFLKNDFANSAKTLQTVIKTQESGGRQPDEQLLQTLMSAEYKQNNAQGTAAALEKLVTYYPKPDYWTDLITFTQKKPGFSDRLTLDVYRLMMQTNTMSRPGDYMEAAQLALQAALPGEAKTIIEKGIATKALQGPDSERAKRMLDKATKDAAEDQKTLAQNEKEAAAQANGTALIKLGEAYASYGQYDKAIAVMQQGLAKGGLKNPDDAKLRAGVVMLQGGKRAEAEKVLKSITAKDGSADLGRLWLLALKKA